MRIDHRFFLMLVLGLSSFYGLAQDSTCNEVTKSYNPGNFDPGDFLETDSGIVIDDDISLDTNRELDLENLVLGLDQPFYVDYLSEGAGASHLFGFFFFDIDTDLDGIPDFFETGPNDDLDGDLLLNFEDLDDDNDGIPDLADVGPGPANSMPASAFRNGTAAAANGEHANNYWQFVPNSVVTEGTYTGYFEHPGAYLYLDSNSNNIPDMMEYRAGYNTIPPYVVDKDVMTGHPFNDGEQVPGFLGNFSYSGTPADTVDDSFHWIGSTVFYIADDDGGTGQHSTYLTYTPYGTRFSDTSGTTNAQPDYLIYGTSDIDDDRIPSELKNEDGSARIDPRGQEYWRYRWYTSDVSGSREMVFFLVVFYPSGGSNVNTYYSKSGFNLDTPPSNPGRNGATSGDAFGTTNYNNWFPGRRDLDDHNLMTQAVFGEDWYDIVNVPPNNFTTPTAINPANQAWVDEWENWNQNRRVIQYRALADWFSGTAVDANDIINGRYSINMASENDSSIIRAIGGRMAHLMVGAPEESQNAWLLGWEDLFGGGDRDFEDVVFYVKREAGGQLQSLNVAEELRETYDDFSLSQVTFDFVDNFDDDLWGVEGNYVNYYYRLAGNDDWIPLLGDQHERNPDLFQPGSNGETIENSGRIRRRVTIEIQDKKQEVYWKVEMATNNVDIFTPVVYEAEVSYQFLVHDFFYNSAIIPNSNIRYIPAFQTPNLDWPETNRNRGHLYSLRTFEHGSTLTVVENNVNPETTPELQPGQPFNWDAGVTMLQNFLAGTERVIYSYVPQGTAVNGLNDNLRRVNISLGSVDPDVVTAFNLTDEKQNNIWINNFHEPDALVQDRTSASLWLSSWIHGYSNPTVADGDLVANGPERSWLLGGINRASVQVVRATGLAPFVFGSDVPLEVKRSYVDFISSEEQLNLPTRLLIGSESGMLHMIDAGTWVGRRKSASDVWADGHYLNDNFGTGAEVWSYLPGHLLDDIKFNYTGASTVSAKVDATAISAVIGTTDNWQRVAFVTQGYKGGSETSGGQTLTGNAIIALDITDPDDPSPMWERVDDNTQDMVNPPSIGWAEMNGNNSWIIAYASGATPVTGQAPSFYLVNALTGQEIANVSVGTADPDHVMVGTPALLDTDNNGYVDYVVGATSEGIIYAANLKTGNTLTTTTVNNARFFHTPNVSVLDEENLELYIISSDHPYVYDEDLYSGSNFQNGVYGYTFSLTDRTFTLNGSYQLPERHKVFARPALVGDQLVIGTATGDTLSLCDADPSDPGNLTLLDTNLLNAGDPPITDTVSLGAPIAGSIIVYGREILAHVNNVTEASAVASPFARIQSRDGSPNVADISHPEPTAHRIATVFGTLGWQDNLMRNLNLGN